MMEEGPFLRGRFVSRPNRFVAHVHIGEAVRPVHVPSSGRMAELLVPGAEVLVRPTAAGRRTQGRLWGVRYQGSWVAIDTTIVRPLLARAFARNLLPELAPVATVRWEVAVGRHRIDVAWDDPGGRVFLEVKSVTLVDRGVALFPDAPTERGRRQVQALAALARAGVRCHVLFLVQRDDGALLRPHFRHDPAFARALAEAARAGVGLHARSLLVGPGTLGIGPALPVDLPENLPGT